MMGNNCCRKCNCNEDCECNCSKKNCCDECNCSSGCQGYCVGGYCYGYGSNEQQNTQQYNVVVNVIDSPQNTCSCKRNNEKRRCNKK